MALLLAGCGDGAPQPDPLERAQAALARGDGITAEVELRGMIEAGAPPEAVAAYLGEAKLVQGRLPEAREWLGEGRFSDDSVAHGFHMLGRLEMREGNLPASGQAFDRALAVGSEDPDLWVDIGRLRYRGGEQSQAFEASERAVVLGPDDADALHFRAQLVRDAEGMAAALPWFERALVVSPDNPEILGDYAATLGELGRARDMLVAVRHLVEVDPGNRRAYFLQAVLAARAGNHDLALVLLQRSGDVDRGVPAAMLLSAVIDMERGNYASAAQMLERLAAMQPDNRRVAPLLARALALGRNDRELVYRFGPAAGRRSASPYLQTLVARSYEAIGERERAASLLDRAAATDRQRLAAIGAAVPFGLAGPGPDDDGRAVLARVRAAQVAGDEGKAVASARGFARRFPGSADARALLGDAYLGAGRAGAAVDAFHAAARIRRTWPVAFKLATSLAASGRDAESIGVLRAFLLGQPGIIEAMTVLATRLAEAGEWTQAARYADLAIAWGGARDPMLLALRARAALVAGDIDTAMALAEAAHDLQPMHSVAAATLAEAYRAAGFEPELVAIAEAKARLLTSG